MIKIEGINPWHFLWIGVIFSEVLTFIMTTILSLLWWGYISIDLLLIGAIDAFIVALIVIIIVIYFVNRIKEAEFINIQLNQEINSLRGMLPICPHCKNIRNEEGLWNRVEEYIKHNSDAELTHCLCPDCLRKLYPDIADQVLANLESTTS